MNGEIYQMARIVAFARDNMRSLTATPMVMRDFENTYYDFAGDDTSDQADNVTDNTWEWCQKLRDRGLKDLFMLINMACDDLKYAGFANAQQKCIITRFYDGLTTRWIPIWDFKDDKKMWIIRYTEKLWENPPEEPPVFENPIEGFKDVLKRIEAFARKIDCDVFAEIFGKSFRILTSENDPEIPGWMQETIPNLKGENLRLFLAASASDVFGAMGSWNDDPRGIATTMGLDDVYMDLSKELYRQNRTAIMYAVNGEQLCV